MRLTTDFETILSILILVDIKSRRKGRVQFSLVSRVRLFVTPWAVHARPPLSITNSQSLLKLVSTKSVMSSNHLILCLHLCLPPSIYPSLSIFSNESVLYIRWPKYWSFSFSISPYNEHSGLISFRMDWLDLLAVQGTLKSLLLKTLEVTEDESKLMMMSKLRGWWVNSGSWWWTERTGMLWFMGSQRVGHNWATELNWNL